jgi:hypothetical protein
MFLLLGERMAALYTLRYANEYVKCSAEIEQWYKRDRDDHLEALKTILEPQHVTEQRRHRFQLLFS